MLGVTKFHVTMLGVTKFHVTVLYRDFPPIVHISCYGNIGLCIRDILLSYKTFSSYYLYIYIYKNIVHMYIHWDIGRGDMLCLITTATTECVQNLTNIDALLHQNLLFFYALHPISPSKPFIRHCYFFPCSSMCSVGPTKNKSCSIIRRVQQSKLKSCKDIYKKKGYVFFTPTLEVLAETYHGVFYCVFDSSFFVASRITTVCLQLLFVHQGDKLKLLKMLLGNSGSKIERVFKYQNKM